MGAPRGPPAAPQGAPREPRGGPPGGPITPPFVIKFFSRGIIKFYKSFIFPRWRLINFIFMLEKPKTKKARKVVKFHRIWTILKPIVMVFRKDSRSEVGMAQFRPKRATF